MDKLIAVKRMSFEATVLVLQAWDQCRPSAIHSASAHIALSSSSNSAIDVFPFVGLSLQSTARVRAVGGEFMRCIVRFGAAS